MKKMILTALMMLSTHAFATVDLGINSDNPKATAGIERYFQCVNAVGEASQSLSPELLAKADAIDTYNFDPCDEQRDQLTDKNMNAEAVKAIHQECILKTLNSGIQEVAKVFHLDNLLAKGQVCDL